MDVIDRFTGALLDGAYELLDVAVPAGGGPVLAQDYRRYAVHFLCDAAQSYHCTPFAQRPASVGYPVATTGPEKRLNRWEDGHLPTAPWFVVPDAGVAFTVRIAVALFRDWGISRAFEQSKPLEQAPVGATIKDQTGYGEYNLMEK